MHSYFWVSLGSCTSVRAMASVMATSGKLRQPREQHAEDRGGGADTAAAPGEPSAAHDRMKALHMCAKESHDPAGCTSDAF